MGSSGFHVHCHACGGTWVGEDLARLDRFRWAARRKARIYDITTELTMSAGAATERTT